MVTCAAALAYHGLLGPVDAMWLSYKFDLSTIPVQHLLALVSCATLRVDIYDFNGCDLVTLLDSVKSQYLRIESIDQSWSLGREETRALVRAMETRVERVDLVGSFEDETLVEYSGQGRCWNFSAESIVELEAWARSRDWTVTHHTTCLDVNPIVTLTKPGSELAIRSSF